MANPYSLDLRQRILDSYLKGEGSYRQLAQRHGVSVSFIRDLMRRHRQTGTIVPKPHSGGPKAQLSADTLEFLQKLIAEKPKITLAELQTHLDKTYQIRVSLATLSRTLQKLGLARQKGYSLPNRTENQNGNGASPSLSAVPDPE
jgi:transposase